MVRTFETSKPTLRNGYTSSNMVTPPNSTQRVPPIGHQVFKHMNLWVPFSFKPPQWEIFSLSSLSAYHVFVIRGDPGDPCEWINDLNLEWWLLILAHHSLNIASFHKWVVTLRVCALVCWLHSSTNGDCRIQIVFAWMCPGLCWGSKPEVSMTYSLANRNRVP